MQVYLNGQHSIFDTPASSAESILKFGALTPSPNKQRGSRLIGYMPLWVETSDEGV
jgi:hypothetical protein